MSTTLIDLLEHSFLPQVIPHSGADYQGSFRVAIRWLEQTVGREPTLDDATTENITAMQHALADAGMSWSRIRQLKIKIGSLRKHAYRLGLVDHYESVPTIKLPDATPGYLREVASDDTVAGWYRMHFREPLAERVKRARLGIFDKAVERFDNAFDRHVRLAEVSEAMLTQFQQVLTENGMSPTAVAKEPRAIRHILAAWNAERWPVSKQKTKQPSVKPSFIESSCQVDKTRVTLSEFLEYVYLVERSVKPSTRRVLRSTIRLFRVWNGGSILLSELTESLVSRWLADCEIEITARTGKPPVPKTIRSKRSNLLVIWRYAWITDYIDDCPKTDRIRKIKMPRTTPVAWTLDELNAILKACDNVPGACRRTGVVWAPWWRAYVLTAFDSALRLSDMLSLRFDQVSAKFPVCQEKTGDSHVVLLSPATLDAIDAIRHPEREVVFDWQKSLQLFFIAFNRIVKAAGVRPGTSKFLRRSSASYVERDHPGMAMRHLGHRTPGLAERNYIDPTIAGTVRPPPPSIGLLSD